MLTTSGRPDLIEKFATAHDNLRFAMSGADSGLLLGAMRKAFKESQGITERVASTGAGPRLSGYDLDERDSMPTRLSPLLQYMHSVSFLIGSQRVAEPNIEGKRSWELKIAERGGFEDGRWVQSMRWSSQVIACR